MRRLSSELLSTAIASIKTVALSSVHNVCDAKCSPQWNGAAAMNRQ